VLGHPEWATDLRYAKSAARVENKDALLPDRRRHARQTARLLAKSFEKAGVPCGPVNDIAELAATEQLAAVDLVHQLPGGGPKVVVFADPVRPPAATSGSAKSPKLSEHTDEVLGPLRSDVSR
jgi:formyl-CoA transferase